MKRVYKVIALVTLFAVVYQLSPYVGFPAGAVFTMFLIAPLLVIYMVYVILKSGTPSGHTFDERFYDDFENSED